MRLTSLQILGDRATQLTRLQSQGWRTVTFKAAPVVVAFKTMGNQVFVKGWTGKADKPTFYYSFRDMGRAQAYVDEYVKHIAANQARKAERKAARVSAKAADYWAVGDVVYNSWGYDQTNVDYYQVIEVKAKSVVLRELKQNSSDVQGGPLGGYAQPRRNEFIGESFTKICGTDGYIRFEHGGSSKWDGKPKYTSSYH